MRLIQQQWGRGEGAWMAGVVVLSMRPTKARLNVKPAWNLKFLFSLFQFFQLLG